MVGDDKTSDKGAKALTGSLGDCGIDAVYVGRMNSASRIAASVAGERAEAVEVCVAGDSSGMPVVRDLLRELKRDGTTGVSIVVHRVQ